MKKKIFHIIPELEVGGTEKQLLLVLPALQKTYENHVVCLMGEGPIGGELQREGVAVHYLLGRGNSDLSIPFRLLRLLRKNKPEAVVTYLIYADIVGRIAARLAGIRILIESHRSHLFGPAWRHQLDRFTRFLVTHYTCQTKATKELLQHVLKIPTSSITIIPNAVELQLPAKNVTTRTKYGIKPSDTVLVCVANLKPEKDIPTLLSAFEALHAKYATLHLWLVGDGPEKPKLQQQIASYHSKDHIHFLGMRNDVANILREAHIFVLPTHIEGMSNALLEALAAGLACVTTDIPANCEIITTGKTGFLVPVGEASALAGAIEQLIASPALRQQIGQAARDYVQQQHSVKAVAAAWNRLIQSQVAL